MALGSGGGGGTRPPKGLGARPTRGLTERLLLAVEDEEATLWLLAALRCKNAAVADVGA